MEEFEDRNFGRSKSESILIIDGIEMRARRQAFEPNEILDDDGSSAQSQSLTLSRNQIWPKTKGKKKKNALAIKLRDVYIIKGKSQNTSYKITKNSKFVGYCNQINHILNKSV